MSSHVCERCGAPASVTVATVPANRGGIRPPTSELRYCVSCARAVGVPIPLRRETPEVFSEPEPPTWADVELHLAQYEQILRNEPALRDHVMSMVRQLRRQAKRLPPPLPDPVAAAFARIAAGEP